jgi:hypothetical protein
VGEWGSDGGRNTSTHLPAGIGKPLRVFPSTVPSLQVSKHSAPAVSFTPFKLYESYIMGRITMSSSGFQDFMYWASILKIPVLRRWRMPFASNLWRGKDFLLSVSTTFQPLPRLLPFRVRDDPYPASYEFL